LKDKTITDLRYRRISLLVRQSLADKLFAAGSTNIDLLATTNMRVIVLRKHPRLFFGHWTRTLTVSNVFFTTLVSLLLFAKAEICMRITCPMFLIMCETFTFLKMCVEAYETSSFQTRGFYDMRCFCLRSGPFIPTECDYVLSYLNIKSRIFSIAVGVFSSVIPLNIHPTWNCSRSRKDEEKENFSLI